MKVDLKNLVSMTEANQNFSKVAKLVDENGSIVILKNNIPRYVLIDCSQAEIKEAAEEQSVEAIARNILDKHVKAFEELAK